MIEVLLPPVEAGLRPHVRMVRSAFICCIDRSVQAWFTARCTKAVSLDADTSQPTIVPANASITIVV